MTNAALKEVEDLYEDMKKVQRSAEHIAQRYAKRIMTRAKRGYDISLSLEESYAIVAADYNLIDALKKIAMILGHDEDMRELESDVTSFTSLC